MKHATAYACTDCYILAHDSEHVHPHSVEHDDISLTDWYCTICSGIDLDERDFICTGCENTLTEYGITIGGTCDLGDHTISGYWDYHTYLTY